MKHLGRKILSVMFVLCTVGVLFAGLPMTVGAVGDDTALTEEGTAEVQLLSNPTDDTVNATEEPRTTASGDCTHAWNQENAEIWVCTTCGLKCTHTEYGADGICSVCGKVCSHDNGYTNGICNICALPCSHGASTDNVCDTCGAKKSAVTVSCNPENTGMLTGGGLYWQFDTVTVTATAKPGWSFNGWYHGSDLVCKTLSYTFTMGDEETNLEARYSSNATVQVTVTTVNSGYFTIGDKKTVQSSYSGQVAVGTQLVLHAKTPEKVSAWVNGSNKKLGSQDTLTVTVTATTVIKLMYKASTANQAMVEFVSDFGQLIAYRSYSLSDTVKYPSGPSKAGYTFTGWDLTEAEIKAKITNGETHITVNPLYEVNGISHTVTVYYGDNGEPDVSTVNDGDSINIVAKTIDGSEFSYWTNAEGTVLSYSPSYYVRILDDMTVYAKYGQPSVEKAPIITMDTPRTFTNGTNSIISFTVTYDVPDSYRFEEVGIVRTTVETDTSGLVIGGENVKRNISSLTTDKGSYTLNLNVSNAVSTTVYARGYIVVTNLATGNTETIYTADIISKSFS